MKYVTKIMLLLLIFILTVLITITVCFIIQKNTGKIVYFFNYTSFYNTGNSMDPIIPQGNLIIIKKLDKYDKGQIITYVNDEDIVVTHRVIDYYNNKYITKGDSNNFVDGYHVDYNDIYGKVITYFQVNYIIKYARYILFVLIVVPLAIYYFKGVKHVR